MNRDYDIAIVGGGLAGLALAIQMRREGHRTILFEKETYPFHKVCGEYISLESWNFLQELGVPLSDMNLPVIERLMVSAPNGKFIHQPLPLGGFGISRFTLDKILAGIASREGVVLMQNTRVNDVQFSQSQFTVQTTGGDFKSKVATGAFGKRSNLDMRLKRDFLQKRRNRLNHYIAVKYHIRITHDADLIALHNFENGYCGISQVDNHRQCLCYLTNSENLRKNGNSIRALEENVLMKNPFLKEIFTKAEFLYPEPLTISQISFNRKTQVQDHMLMVGDAAGMITPLCGNGMSMALHASKIACEVISRFLDNDIDRYEMEKEYSEAWEQSFARRLATGRFIQRFFGNTALTNIFLSSLKPFPAFTSFLIRQTHGVPF